MPLLKTSTHRRPPPWLAAGRHRADLRSMAGAFILTESGGSAARAGGAASAAYRYEIVLAEARDRPNIMRLLKRFVTRRRAAHRHRWIYERNPQGRAATWLALEPERGEIVGFTSIFAREFLVEGTRVLGSVGFDAFVRPDHRRRGIAALLHGATLAAMNRGEVAHRFMCGAPVPANLHALGKAGTTVVGQTGYLHLPLTPRGLVGMLPFGGTVGGPTLGRLDELATRFDRPLSWAWASLAERGACRVRALDAVGPELDQIWSEHAAQRGVVGVRDASYVRWRYFENPLTRPSVVGVWERDRLRGWAVLEHAPRGCLIVDHLFPAEGDGAGGVLRAVIAAVARTGAPRLTVFSHLASPTNWLFRRHGFIAGRTPSVYQVLGGDAALRQTLLDPRAWYLRAGDFDPEAVRWSLAPTPGVWTDPNYVSGRVRGLRRAEA